MSRRRKKKPKPSSNSMKKRKFLKSKFIPVAQLKSALRNLEKELPGDLTYLKTHVDKLWEHASRIDERVQDLEIQMNLVTRLLTTVCLEQFGMRLSVLRKMIRRVEKEAIDDSQIQELEKLYKLEFHDKNVASAKKRRKKRGKENGNSHGK